MNDIIVTKQVAATIEWNKEQAIKEATEFMAKYDGLEFEEKQLPRAKKDLAQLRKVAKEINTQALNIDKELTAPVKEFRSEVKEVIDIVNLGINSINEQVKLYEQKRKDERIKIIIEFEEYQPIRDWVWRDEWLQKSWTDSKLKEEFIRINNQIQSGINTIKLTCTQNGLDSQFYIDKFMVLPLEQVIERIIEDVNNLKTEEVIEVKVAETNGTEVTINRKLTGTIEQLKELKAYADKIGVKWYE